MRIAASTHMGRISPLLDVAERFLVLEIEGGRQVRRDEFLVQETGLGERARRIAALGATVLICGAVSRPLEAMLSTTVRLVPNTCGPVEEVIQAFLSGRLDEQSFLMPGCRGRRRRFRGGRGRGGPGKGRR
jgi:predicted Fe-Mo cluster-binding NifX family protein